MNTATKTSNIAEVVPLYTQIAFCTTPFAGRVYFLRCFFFLFEKMWWTNTKSTPAPVTCKDNIIQPKAANDLRITSAQPARPH